MFDNKFDQYLKIPPTEASEIILKVFSFFQIWMTCRVHCLQNALLTFFIGNIALSTF